MMFAAPAINPPTGPNGVIKPASPPTNPNLAASGAAFCISLLMIPVLSLSCTLPFSSTSIALPNRASDIALDLLAKAVEAPISNPIPGIPANKPRAPPANPLTEALAAIGIAEEGTF